MATIADRGNFVWYELMTSDPSAAVDFYSRTIGWTTQPFGQPEPGKDPYLMWSGSQGPLGGVMKLPEEAAKMGAPSHWMAHVVVENVDATVAKVRGLGGKILTGPMDIPTVGRLAVIEDPFGAHLSVFRPEGEMTLHDRSQKGEVSWHELMTGDLESAFRFYQGLLGWEKTGSFDMGPMGEYLMYGKGELTLGGMMKAPEGAPNAWVYYFHVEDVPATIEQARAAGATLLYGPQEVPGGDLVAMFLDPQGAAFAIHGPGAGASA